VRRAAHGLTGAAASVGAVALEHVARSFLAPRDNPYPAELLGELRREADETLRACSTLPTPPPDPP
jgi:HPt (histidine-containing phosphotransfer) domain-containing protein